MLQWYVVKKIGLVSTWVNITPIAAVRSCCAHCQPLHGLLNCLCIPPCPYLFIYAGLFISTLSQNHVTHKKKLWRDFCKGLVVNFPEKPATRFDLMYNGCGPNYLSRENLKNHQRYHMLGEVIHYMLYIIYTTTTAKGIAASVHEI